MKLLKARVQNYRSVVDSGWFELEEIKTILVGPNEAGKTAILQALQKLNPPKGTKPLNPLRDFPRSSYNDITTGKVDPSKVTVIEGHFKLEDNEISDMPVGFENCSYQYGRRLDNSTWHSIMNGPSVVSLGIIMKDLKRLCAHIDPRLPTSEEHTTVIIKPSEHLKTMIQGWAEHIEISSENEKLLLNWLDDLIVYIDENNEAEEKRYDNLRLMLTVSERRKKALELCKAKLPVFVYFNNFSRVKPLVHLEHLALRIESNILDDDQYDYGNVCLLKLLGFNARELSSLGGTPAPEQGDLEALQRYRDQLDKRSYQLNAASVKLTEEIKNVWLPNSDRNEADRLRIIADGQYLKVVVEDDLGVEIELDQRSEGFQWLVSFFIIFFAEAAGKHKNAILLLDEPGMSLHALKQRDFRKTISKLGESNQTIFTTHSPFLVGPNELDKVRVVEMTDRKVGTKVHTTITSVDPVAMLPLQEALGYDLAQSLFAQQRNLVLEGLTDYWYIEAVSQLLRDSKIIDLNEKISMVPAGTSSKVVYYATILYAQRFKVVALLDSDSAGDQAAKQDALVHLLGNKSILQTKEFYTGSVIKPEIEDLLRDTLVSVGKSELGWDISIVANSQLSRPIIDIFSSEIKDFSKYKLSKAFLRWTRSNDSNSLTADERNQWKLLIERINKTLK